MFLLRGGESPHSPAGDLWRLLAAREAWQPGPPGRSPLDPQGGEPPGPYSPLFDAVIGGRMLKCLATAWKGGDAPPPPPP